MSKKWRIRLAKILIVLSILLLIGLWALGHYLSPKLRTKLVDMSQKYLDTELQMDDLTYRAPYGMTLYGVRMLGKDPQGGQIEIFTAKRIDLRLDELPQKD